MGKFSIHFGDTYEPYNFFGIQIHMFRKRLNITKYYITNNVNFSS